MVRHCSWALCAVLILSACLPQPHPPQPSAAEVASGDRLLTAGLRELVDGRPTTSLETLVSSQPGSKNAGLAAKLLEWKRQHPVAAPDGRKSAETEVRELREENRKLRSDLEQLRKLMIDTERRSR